MSLLHGIYISNQTSLFFNSRFRTGCYGLCPDHLQNQFIKQSLGKSYLHTKKFLYSFIAQDSSDIRRKLFENKPIREDTFIFNSTKDFNLYALKGSNPQDHWQLYDDSIAHFKFVLCPKGTSPASLRLFEVMKMGVAPVIISDQLILPQGPRWSEFALFIKEKDISELDALLTEKEDYYLVMGKKAQNAYEQFFAVNVYFDYLVDQLISIMNHQKIPECLFWSFRNIIVRYWMLQRQWRFFKKNSMIQRVRQFFINRKAAIKVVPTLSPDECNQYIAKILQTNSPALIGRMGWVEGYCTGKILLDRTLSEKEQKMLRSPAGVFPMTSGHLQKFAATYLDAIAHADLLGLMDAPFHGWLIKTYAKKLKLAELSALEPYFFNNPWSWQLHGKTVLVVHPFTASIGKQYLTVREQIFDNPKMLPEFTLKLMTAPQTVPNNKMEYSSWFEALTILEQKVQNESFDVALLGCGAYGLPLGASIKKMGKIAIHLGGATQLLFGISGGRWRNNPKFQQFMNESWSPPLEEERPPGWQEIEEGGYW